MKSSAAKGIQRDGSVLDRPVVVGIDGSQAAIRAAVWASSEAERRNVSLHLVHVIDGSSTRRDRGYARAGHVLYKAWMAVVPACESVLVDSDVREGDTVAELVEASRGAGLICIGSRRHDSSEVSAAAELVRRAHSPVVVVERSPRSWAFVPSGIHRCVRQRRRSRYAVPGGTGSFAVAPRSRAASSAFGALWRQRGVAVEPYRWSRRHAGSGLE